MRREDFDRLSTPYSADSPSDRDLAFAEALGIGVKSIRELLAEVLSDLDPEHFGIRWWRSYRGLGTKRRILVADHLYVCAHSIEVNLAEAYLHHVEARGYREDQASRLARIAVLRPDGSITPKHPVRSSPMDDIPGRMTTLHIGGFFRALVSSLDCLGAVTVGVAGLPVSILKTSLSEALRELSSRKASDRQRVLGDSIQRVVERAGPTGWLAWATDYRNMLVHRGRRLQAVEIDVDSRLVDAQGRPVLRSVPVLELPVDPAKSDVEAMIAWKEGSPVLLEDADKTMEGLLDSAKRTIAEVGRLLGDLWHERRAHPGLIEQPEKQWPTFPSSSSTKFKGCQPTRAFHPSAIVANPVMTTRIQAAALSTDMVSRWQTFD
jgi:hypothetical protein